MAIVCKILVLLTLMQTRHYPTQRYVPFEFVIDPALTRATEKEPAYFHFVRNNRPVLTVKWDGKKLEVEK